MIRDLNNWLGNKLADLLSTMAFFYLCVILDSIELPPVIKAHDIITWCTYLSQTVIQLLALPLLAYQNKVQDKNHKQTISHLKKIHDHLTTPTQDPTLKK